MITAYDTALQLKVLDYL